MNQETNKSNDLFGNTGEWEIVETSAPPEAGNREESVTELFEAPAVENTPQVWEDIPAEENPEEKTAFSREIPAANDNTSTGEDIPEEEAIPREEILSAGEIAATLQSVSEEEKTPPSPVEENTQEEVTSPAEEKLPVPPRVIPVTGKLDSEDEDAPIHYRHTAPDGITSLNDLGKFLAKTRVAENLSPEKVCDATKIRPDYLEAIETGDISELPQAVYVLAYIRKLCELYSVDTANLGGFFNDLRDGFAYELPEDINKSIVGHENDEEQQKKLRQLALALISSAALVLVAIIVGIVFLLVGAVRSGVFSSGNGIKDAEIVDMQGEPRLLFYAIPARRR